MSRTSDHNETEPRTRQPSPFVQNAAADNEAPGEMEKRILRKAPPGSLPDGVLGQLSWKTNPENEKRFYELILKEPLFEIL